MFIWLIQVADPIGASLHEKFCIAIVSVILNKNSVLPSAIAANVLYVDVPFYHWMERLSMNFGIDILCQNGATSGRASKTSEAGLVELLREQSVRGVAGRSGYGPAEAALIRRGRFPGQGGRQGGPAL
jgi:hypothetical protein